MTIGQLRAQAPVLRGRSGLPAGAGTAAVAVGAAALAAWIAVLHPESYRYALAGALLINLIVVAMRWPRLAIVLTLMWLPFLALVRRLLIEDTGSWTSNDPLVLVGPLVAIFLVYRIFFVERRRLDGDRLSKLVVALLAIALIQAFNPLGVGGPLAGVGGLLFLGVPLLWFFIGRALPDRRTISFLVPAIIVVGVLAAGYGILQTEVILADTGELPAQDQAWYEVAGYVSLQAGDTSNNKLRPFSTFSSNSEYSAFMAVGALFAFALFFHRRYWAVLAVMPLVFGIFFAGGRAVLALTLIAATVLTGLRTRSLAAGLAVVLIGVSATYGVAATLGPALDRAAGVTGDAIVERQVSGLLNPLDPNRSTFIGHWQNFTNGVADGFANPAGEGTGATNRGGTLADSGSRETDNDVADVFVSFGAIGGLVYLAIIVLAFKYVFTRYTRTRDMLVFAVAGLMIVTFGQWLNGGHWATAAYLWFFVGWATQPEEGGEDGGDGG